MSLPAGGDDDHTGEEHGDSDSRQAGQEHTRNCPRHGHIEEHGQALTSQQDLAEVQEASGSAWQGRSVQALPGRAYRGSHAAPPARHGSASGDCLDWF